jgi:hypothetical protein
VCALAPPLRELYALALLRPGLCVRAPSLQELSSRELSSQVLFWAQPFSQGR